MNRKMHLRELALIKSEVEALGWVVRDSHDAEVLRDKVSEYLYIYRRLTQSEMLVLPDIKSVNGITYIHYTLPEIGE